MQINKERMVLVYEEEIDDFLKLIRLWIKGGGFDNPDNSFRNIVSAKTNSDYYLKIEKYTLFDDRELKDGEASIPDEIDMFLNHIKEWFRQQISADSLEEMLSEELPKFPPKLVNLFKDKSKKAFLANSFIDGNWVLMICSILAGPNIHEKASSAVEKLRNFKEIKMIWDRKK